MNIHYEEDRARSMLYDIRRQNHDAPGVSPPPYISELDPDSVFLADWKNPPSVRVMKREDGQTYEVVTRAIGVLCGTNLPPVSTSSRPDSLPSIRNMRQQARITGLGSADFELDHNHLKIVHDLFVTHCRGRTVAPIDFIPHEGHTCIESHARYFTDRKLIPFDKNVSFTDDIDPDHVLRDIQPAELIHGPDNVVEYGRREVDEEGKLSYTPHKPSLFKCGDVVEVAFSCVGIPVKNGRVMVMLNLRGLTLIDDTVRKDSELLRARNHVAHSVQLTPKRKALYLTGDREAGSASGPSKRGRGDDYTSMPDDRDATLRGKEADRANTSSKGQASEGTDRRVSPSIPVISVVECGPTVPNGNSGVAVKNSVGEGGSLLEAIELTKRYTEAGKGADKVDTASEVEGEQGEPGEIFGDEYDELTLTDGTAGETVDEGMIVD